MKSIIRSLTMCFLLPAAFAPSLLLSAPAEAAATTPSSTDTMLTRYEAVRAALAHDDLPAARQAAALLSDQPAARRIAQAADLAAAREAFKALSTVAVGLAKDRPGYFIAFCPMVPDDQGYWVQTTRRISNPYMGSRMAGCGEIED
jgi:hypothetical protein